MTVPPAHRHYIPAMGRDWLLPLCDPLTRALGVPAAHRRLAEQADVTAGQHVLEIGTGTGNLALLVARMHPDAHVVGLDPDPRALARARRKSAKQARHVQWDLGSATTLPYPDASVDAVLSAFMLHHLDAAETPVALREIRRVLRPGGGVHVVDFGGGPGQPTGRLARLINRNPRLNLNAGERIPALLREAEFTEVAETGHRTLLGARYTFYRASR